MGGQIIKQPNGLYAAWSNTVDSFIIVDATPEELIEEWLSDERHRVTEFVNKTVAALDAGEKPYHQFTMTYDEALAMHKKIHGTDFNPKM